MGRNANGLMKSSGDSGELTVGQLGLHPKALKAYGGENAIKGYGSYGKTNVDEFWAEVVTKGIHGKSDKYTKKAIGIAKKYKL